VTGRAGARILHERDEIAAATARLGSEISDAYPAGVSFVAVLKGSIFFVADLVRKHDRSL